MVYAVIEFYWCDDLCVILCLLNEVESTYYVIVMLPLFVIQKLNFSRNTPKWWESYDWVSIVGVGSTYLVIMISWFCRGRAAFWAFWQQRSWEVFQISASQDDASVHFLGVLFERTEQWKILLYLLSNPFATNVQLKKRRLMNVNVSSNAKS